MSATGAPDARPSRKRRKTASGPSIPEAQRRASVKYQARITPSLAAELADLGEKYDLPPALVLGALRDLAHASGRLDAALFAAMLLGEDPEAYARVVGRPASEDALAFARRTGAKAKRVVDEARKRAG